MLNYFIIGRGRTGSILSAFLLNEYIKYQLNDETINTFRKIENYITLEKFESNVVYHAHTIENLYNVPDNFKIIFSRRNLFDAVISWFVSRQTDVWQVFDGDSYPTLAPFEINPKEFIAEVVYRNKNENEIAKYLSNIPHTEIYYEEFCSDLNKFFEKLNIDFKLATTQHLPHKLDLDYSKLILNYSELTEVYQLHKP